MVYIKNNNTGKDAIQHIEDVLFAHKKMLIERDSDQNILNKKIMSQHMKKDLSRVLEEEKEELRVKIAAIKYTLDYVKLMLKASNYYE